MFISIIVYDTTNLASSMTFFPVIMLSIFDISQETYAF